jgi:rod shape determining protein RodA
MIQALQKAGAFRLFRHIDWFVLLAAIAVSLLGLATMRSFSVENAFFERQLIWICLSIGVFFIASMPHYQFLRRTPVVVGLFGATIFILSLIFLFGSVIMGSQNRFDLGFFFVQPSDPAKLVLIAVLAKYFARRHVVIKDLRHILVSGSYAFFMFALVFLQPDFGSAIIVFAIWFGMVLVSGLSWKHLGALLVTGVIIGAGTWSYGLQEYQKQRVLTFLHPLTDIQGTGYNAYQSTVAVGSGEVLGKGVGYGTQSKLQFLPEFQTDFIFAAYAEEWGFVGVLLLLGLFSIIMVRILGYALHAGDNFDALFSAGIAIYLLAQFIVHVGMNMGLLPITGATLPFMSYGGSHLLTEFAALGVLMGMRRRARPVARAQDGTELLGAL